jgi:serine/threonine protein kinase
MQQAATLTQADVDLRISSSIRDGALAKLLTRALQVDPSRRASASELLGSWYFKRPW